MVESNVNAGGWYVECEPASSEMMIFERCGFTKVPMTYLQPRLHTDITGQSQDKILEILYKPFGRRYGPPVLSSNDLLRDLREIIMIVYYMDSIAAEQAIARMTLPLGKDDIFMIQSL